MMLTIVVKEVDDGGGNEDRIEDQEEAQEGQGEPQGSGEGGGEMKGLTASIFTDELIGTCSNGGISSRCKAVTVVGIEDADIFSASEDRPAVKLVKRTIMGRTVVHAEPVERPADGCVGWMMGGSYIGTSDSRFSDAVGFYGAVALHDRCETPEQYRQLSS